MVVFSAAPSRGQPRKDAAAPTSAPAPTGAPDATSLRETTRDIIFGSAGVPEARVGIEAFFASWMGLRTATAEERNTERNPYEPLVEELDLGEEVDEVVGKVAAA